MDSKNYARALSVGILGVLLVLVLATFQDYGISWDEEVQNTYGKKLLALYTSGLTDLSAFSYQNLFYYGGFFDLIASLVNLVSPFGEYETRHLLGGLMGVAGYTGVWLLTRPLAGERAALVTLALLATTPLLYGHNFINPKDAPFAWLTVWVAYFGARAILEGPALRSTTVAGLGIMLGLALGSRVLAGAWLLALLGAIALSVAASNPTGFGQWPREFWQRAKPLWWSLPIAFVLMAIFWPWSMTSASNIEVAVEEFSSFPWVSKILWNGEMVMSNDLPWDYLPVLLWNVLPELMLVGLSVVMVSGALGVYRHGHGLFARPQATALVFVVAIVVFPIIACAIIRPTLYNGMRHFLFVVPLLGMFSGMGLAHLLTWLGQRQKSLAIFGALLMVAAMGRQAWIAVDLHPNQYVYYNALAGDLAGAQSKFGLDYWGTSLAEASRRLADTVAQGHHVDGTLPHYKVLVCARPWSAQYFLPKNFEVTWDIDEADFYIAINGLACDWARERGLLMTEVKRRGVTLSYVVDLRSFP